MSKSLARITAPLAAADVQVSRVDMAAETRRAQVAARAAGCALDPIAKSIILQGRTSGRLHLFLTPGGNQVVLGQAAALAGQPLDRANTDTVRRVKGSAIGGVAPLGHLEALPIHDDPRLLDFPVIWAAAGRLRQISAIAPTDLIRITGAKVAVFGVTHPEPEAQPALARRIMSM